MFDIFYIGNNEELVARYPFAKQVSAIEDIKSKTTNYWLIEQDTVITDYEVLEFKPDVFTKKYNHVWKWDNSNYGGLYLNYKRGGEEIVHHNNIVCRKQFTILLEQTPGNFFEDNPTSTHVWCVDPEYKLKESIEWAPGNFEPNFIHSFHLRGQLEHKYPSEEGGIKLYPTDWKDADVKYHSYLDASVDYPIMYVKDIENYSQRNTFKEDYVWFIDAEHDINMATIDWVPNPFEEDYIHVFRMPYQLQEKFPMAMGGIRLVPKDWRNTEVKIHPACPIEDTSYDVFYVDEDEFDADTFTEYASRSRTDWFWIVDRDFEFNGKLLFVPAKHEREYIHVFKIPGHLDFRYPVDFTDPWDYRCGGVRLVHKDFDYTKHKYQEGVVPVRYDIFYSDNIKNYETFSKKARTKMFWLIDNEHTLNDVIDFVPTRDEQKYLLNFKITNQLEHKYPQQEGGVNLVPKSINANTPTKYKGNLFVKLKEYPILYVADVNDLSIVTEDSWVIDKEYQIDHDIDWIPDDFSRRCIHTFHVPNQLNHKYPEKMGGVRWIPKDWNGEYVVHDDVPVKPKTYKVYFVEDPNDYTQAKGECWLVDSEYQIDEDILWVPSTFEKEYIHAFHVPGQLEHKYPEAIGGVRWVPANWETAETKIHEDSPFAPVVFDVYRDEETGREQTTKEWFWVVDSDVTVHTNFDFDFVPEVWDNGKKHVWQKLNPVTGRQFDYGGVSLCPKIPQTKGRPKYIRKAVCTQNLFEVAHLNSNSNILEQLLQVDSTTPNSMFWAVDPDVKVPQEFLYDYYPTQWDQKNVHVFTDNEGNHRGVRLYPKGTFTNNTYTLEQIANNSFPDLKLMNTVASVATEYPTERLEHMTVIELQDLLHKYKDRSYVWTIDPDVREDNNIIKESFTPNLADKDRVHVWQRVDDKGDNLGHGGLRLWPTNFAAHLITDEQLVTCSIPEQLILDTVGSIKKTYPVYRLQSNTDILEQLIKMDNTCDTSMFWCVDPFTTVYEQFKFDYVPNKWEESYVHVFDNGTGEHRGVRLFPKGTFSTDITLKQVVNNSFNDIKFVDIQATQSHTWPLLKFTDDKPLKRQLEQANVSAPFYTLDTDVELLDIELDYVPQLDAIHKTHSWQKVSVHTDKVYAYGGLRLWTHIPIDITSDDIELNRFKNTQYVKEPATKNIPFEIVYLSYQEPNAQSNYDKLTERFGNIHWIKDVEGIFNAHQTASNTVNSKMFWVIDADADIDADFDFSYIPDAYDTGVVHVWASVNPITGDEYGYGGIKLFNTQQVRDATTWGLDFTTGLSTRFKAMPQISCTTKFNTDAYSTWRSAFRECVKLAAKVDDTEAKQRLEGWLHPVPNADFRAEAKAGAEAGVEYAKQYTDDVESLSRINDYEWLKEQYEIN